VALLATAATFCAACGETTRPQFGAIRIVASTIGTDPDLSGYLIEVEGRTAQSVPSNGTILIQQVRTGRRMVQLSGAAPNCTVDGPGQRSVTVSADDTVSVGFDLQCVPLIGTLRVRVLTSGDQPDTGGYLLSIDTASVQVDASDDVELELRAGTYTLDLGEMAPNCFANDNPRIVSVAFGVVTDITFTVVCSRTNGTIRFTTITTGSDLDPDGYLVMVEDPCSGFYCYYYGIELPIATNGTTTLQSLSGVRFVRLGGVAPNCLILGGSARPVNVTGGDTTEVVFQIDCTTLGRVQLSSVTTGPDFDTDGYQIHLTGEYFYDTPLSDGSAVTLSVFPGTYQASVHGISTNCDVIGDNPRTVTVTNGVIVVVAFDISCATAMMLAYVSDDDGNAEIYTIKSNGVGKTRLTTHTAADEDPDWSPDGSRIVFTSERTGNRDVFVMNADGSSPTRLTTAAQNDYQPAWSPDGTRIAFVSERDGNPEIYLIQADGTNPVRLTQHAAAETQPAWSPDGARIAFRSTRDGNGEIYVMNADGSGLRRLTTSTRDEVDPVWSPDGLSIAFSRLVWCYNNHCAYNLFLINADGSGVAQNPSEIEALQASWSSSNARIAFTNTICDFYYYNCNEKQIAAFHPNGTGLAIIVGGRSPAWRP
jgi:WD40 repeat protein